LGASFLATQGLAEAGFKRFKEGIAADRPTDDFTFSKGCKTFILVAPIEKAREIVDPRMQRPGDGNIPY